MRESPAPWQHGVVLICSNQRPDGAPKPSCGRARAEGLKSWLKPALPEGDSPAAQVRVVTTSCLGLCPADGVAVSLQPGNTLLVVDPDRDREALKAAVIAHAEAEASRGGSRARRLLGKLRGA